jgi:hypothetical protein
MAAQSPDPGLSVDVDRLRALAGGLRATAAGLDGMLVGLAAGVSPAGVAGGQDPVSGLGSAVLGEAGRYYVGACQRGLRELRDRVGEVASGLDATATDYDEQERRACVSFHRLGAAIPDPVSGLTPAATHE